MTIIDNAASSNMSNDTRRMLKHPQNEYIQSEQSNHEKNSGSSGSTKNSKIKTNEDKMIKSSIPYPELESWMHKRIPLERESKEQTIKRYMSVSMLELVPASILSRILNNKHLLKNGRVWHIYRLLMRALEFFFKITCKVYVFHKERIPKNGAIFISNHIRGKEVVAPFISVFKEPVGVFTTLGNGYFADYMETVFGWVSRRGSGSVMVEKMIRALISKHKYFVIWPEGTLERNGKVMQGFSGIVKLYATLNSKRDVIPFQPVYMKEGNERDPIVYYFMEPFFIPRDWLKPLEQGGKTPREIIDYVMLKLARINGQEELVPNRVLERRKKFGLAPWK